MKKLLFPLLLWHYTIAATAQTETDIRKHYTDVNKKIEESKHNGYEGPLYQNQLTINKNSKSWPAVGHYADTVNFWYDDPPDHLPASERNPKNVLLKINTSRVAAGFHASEEYLFKNGKLLFYFLFETEEGYINETRLYFNNKGIMFKSIVTSNEEVLTEKDFQNPTYKDLKPKPASVLAEAKNTRTYF